ncbi:MAG: ATP-dependent protease ATPase subunit HslU [Planctomycetota bacterium]
MDALTPRQVVNFLDRYVVGQSAAKRVIGIALRNRLRRQKLDPAMAQDVLPKNIILAGPTGVGKTELARRLALLLKAPFLKVEATKYTEVGYFGKDVETIARDLVEISVSMVQDEETARVQEAAGSFAEEALLDAMAGEEMFAVDEEERAELAKRRASLRAQLRTGELDEERITISIEDKVSGNMDVFSAMGVEQMGIDMESFMNRVAPPREVERTMTVGRARDALVQREAGRMLDKDVIVREAIRRVEEAGIVFLDELDKVIGAGSSSGPDVSRGGVQRDLLPLVEGCTVQTRHGPVRTDHVLFVAAGAFHDTSPDDLMPELQGRFPLRVELDELSGADFERILTEPEHALTKQYRALLATDGVDITFDRSGVEEIAALAARLNTDQADIGARRLHMVLEKLLDEISFNAQEEGGDVVIDARYVLSRAEAISR